MTLRFQLSQPVACKPVDRWRGIYVELLGTQTRFVQGARWRHRVIESGDASGEPLILIHGVGGHAESFARNMQNLARQGFHVFAIDALYHGLTDKEPYDDDERYLYQVDALIDLLDALGIASAHVEGESMGATIAFHFGLSHPDRARKIVLNTGFGHVKLDKNDFQPVKGDMKELATLSREVVVNPSVEAMRKRLEWVVYDPASMTDEMVAVRLALYEKPDVNESMRKVFRIDSDWSWDLPYGEKDLEAYRAGYAGALDAVQSWGRSGLRRIHRGHPAQGDVLLRRWRRALATVGETRGARRSPDRVLARAAFHSLIRGRGEPGRIRAERCDARRRTSTAGDHASAPQPGPDRPPGPRRVSLCALWCYESW